MLHATNFFVAHTHYWMKGTFQLEVSESKIVIFSIQVHEHPAIYPATPKGSVNPRIRMAILGW
jgi:hypothetical protein